MFGGGEPSAAHSNTVLSPLLALMVVEDWMIAGCFSRGLAVTKENPDKS
jgi:hypothetical protein